MGRRLLLLHQGGFAEEITDALGESASTSVAGLLRDDVPALAPPADFHFDPIPNLLGQPAKPVGGGIAIYVAAEDILAQPADERQL